MIERSVFIMSDANDLAPTPDGRGTATAGGDAELGIILFEPVEKRVDKSSNWKRIVSSDYADGFSLFYHHYSRHIPIYHKQFSWPRAKERSARQCRRYWP